MDSSFSVVVISIGLAVATFTDFTRFKVYNLLTIPLFFAGLAYGLIMSGWAGLLFAFLGAFTGFGILLVPYLLGGLGAGDVKFVMAMGTWVGPAVLLPAILIGCVVVFAYYLIVIAGRDGARGVVSDIQLMFYRMSSFGKNFALNDQFETVQSAANSDGSLNKGRLIPFSAMMSVGILIALALGKIVQSAS